ncbi:hypothetical protein [Pontimicrobium sp. MEBiC06410]
MRNIKQIIENKGKLISYKDKNIKYLEIGNFKDISFRYGVTNDGWIIKNNNNFYLIKNNEKNYIVFFNILELPSDLIIRTVNDKIEELKENDLSIFDFFPIIQITETAFNMESSYWSILCLDLLLKSKLYKTELLDYLYHEKKAKWIPQPLKHKILKYISRVNNENWGNGVM